MNTILNNVHIFNILKAQKDLRENVYNEIIVNNCSLSAEESVTAVAAVSSNPSPSNQSLANSRSSTPSLLPSSKRKQIDLTGQDTAASAADRCELT